MGPAWCHSLPLLMMAFFLRHKIKEGLLVEAVMSYSDTYPAVRELKILAVSVGTVRKD